MKTRENVQKDKTYLLNQDKSPLSYFIPSRDTKRRRLLYFDEEEGRNKALRYAKNQRSIFQEDQDGTAILEPIIFEEGKLNVPKTNPVLQQFLDMHPDNVENGGTLFYEFDPQKIAEQKVIDLNLEVDALIAARSLDLNKMMAIGRIHLRGNVEKMTSAELKHDILLFAKNYPEEFLDAINDPDIEVNDTVARAFSEKYVIVKGKKDIHYNLAKNKKKILTIPFGETKEMALMSWFKSDEGLEFYQFLENEFSE